jgi:hypothetical protein
MLGEDLIPCFNLILELIKIKILMFIIKIRMNIYLIKLHVSLFGLIHLVYIVTCLVTGHGVGLVIGFIGLLQIVSTKNYSAITNSHSTCHYSTQ